MKFQININPADSTKAKIYVDGSKDNNYNEDLDIELSHWIPNSTPFKYKAGTSTEICMKFCQKNLNKLNSYDIVINNHLDVDGILSIYTIMHPEKALKHKTMIEQASHMGDFWAHGLDDAQNLFLAITEYYQERLSRNEDINIIYKNSFEIISKILEGNYSLSQKVLQAKEILLHSDRLLLGKDCTIQVHGKILVSIQVSKELHSKFPNQLESHAKFNEFITDRLVIWPQSVNKHFNQKIKLLIVSTTQGFLYDLYYPSYMWADTVNLWVAPDIKQALHAVEMLQKMEKNPGTWYLNDNLWPFSSKQINKVFPIVLSFVDSNFNNISSSLTPSIVRETLENYWINNL